MCPGKFENPVILEFNFPVLENYENSLLIISEMQILEYFLQNL